MNTLPKVSLKPDFERTAARFEAWWRGEVVDRPPVNLAAKGCERIASLPPSDHATLRERYLDVDYNVACAIARLEADAYLGDTLPVYYPNVGPELTATLLGCELEFSPATSWSIPVVGSLEQWHEVIGRPLDLGNPYWRAVETMTDIAINRCDGRFIVGIADLHDNYDTMAALRDPQNLCIDLMEDRNLIRDVGRDLTRVFKQSFNRLYAHVHAAGMGSTTWTAMYHQGRAYLPSCDFWCMVGADIARDLVLPDIVDEMSVLDRSLFHLDGPGALRHLDLLLAIPELSAVQWVYGAGNGPAERWIEVYRHILRAGKSVQVVAHDAADAMAVLEAVGPCGVWLCIGELFDSEAQVNAFLADLHRMSASPTRRGWHGAGSSGTSGTVRK